MPRCLELEILAATYKPDRVQALRRIRARLEEKREATRKELEATRAGLAGYAAAGEEMEAVVEEYSAVRAKIEGKKWALRELKETT